MPVRTRIARLTRVRSSSADGRRTLNFTTPDLPTGRSRRCPLTFVQPEHVPPFEGEAAWFEMERIADKPWPYWRAVRRVEPPGA